MFLAVYRCVPQHDGFIWFVVHCKCAWDCAGAVDSAARWLTDRPHCVLAGYFTVLTTLLTMFCILLLNPAPANCLFSLLHLVIYEVLLFSYKIRLTRHLLLGRRLGCQLRSHFPNDALCPRHPSVVDHISRVVKIIPKLQYTLVLSSICFYYVVPFQN